jgi:hypothetical protein
LTELRTLLSEEIALHEGLRDDLAFELAQDGNLSGAEFLKLQQRKYIRAQQIEEMEARRIGQVGQLAETWQMETRQLTLRAIIARCSQPLAGEFETCHQTLQTLVDEIRALTRVTAANAQARLKAIDATLAVVGEAARMHPTYSEEGRLQQRPPTFKHTSA